MVKIKITGDEKNKDNGFEVLSTNFKTVALENEEYFVPFPAIEKLKQEGIEFEIIEEKSEIKRSRTASFRYW